MKIKLRNNVCNWHVTNVELQTVKTSFNLNYRPKKETNPCKEDITLVAGMITVMLSQLTILWIYKTSTWFIIQSLS